MLICIEDILKVIKTLLLDKIHGQSGSYFCHETAVNLHLKGQNLSFWNSIRVDPDCRQVLYLKHTSTLLGLIINTILLYVVMRISHEKFRDKKSITHDKKSNIGFHKYKTGV